METSSGPGIACHIGCQYVDFVYRKYDDLKKQHHTRCEENERLQSSVTTLRKEVRELQKQNKEAKTKAGLYDKVKALLTQYKEDCSTLKEKNSELKGRVGQLEYDKEDFRKCVAEYEEKIAKQKDELSKLKEENRKLSEENAALKEENDNALNEVERLKSILNNNPSNTSTAPSRGQIGLDPHSHRKSQNEYNDRDAAKNNEDGEKTPRKKGAQKNHEGKTLTREDVEKFLRENKVDDYRYELHEIGTKGEGKKYRVKYVIGAKMCVVIKEYRYYDDAEIPAQHYSEVTYDGSIRAIAAYLYGEGNLATDKIKDFLFVQSNGMINISEGSAYNFCRDVAVRAERSISQLRTDLLNGKVLYTDATNTRENGKQTYVRNTSNANTVVYTPQDSKTIEEIGKNPVIGAFCGTLMSDHETALKRFGYNNAECNQHTGRYCRKNEEQTHHLWMTEFMELLYEMKDSKAELQKKGIGAFTEDEIRKYFERYDTILAKGRKENEEDKELWKYADDDEQALLRRLEKFKEDHLMFATNFEVEFTNNRSEADLRFLKNRTKLSGGFRQKSGRQICCNIMSIIRTCKKRNMPVFSTLQTIAETGTNVFAVKP